jgi:hypothetical protein
LIIIIIIYISIKLKNDFLNIMLFKYIDHSKIHRN